MKRRGDLRHLLRWYPASWRARYGDEFLALVEDQLEGTALTIRLRSSIAFAGLRERCYGSGLIGARASREHQRRSGSLTVLVAWSIMIIGGAALTKTAEHSASALPAGSRFASQFSYNSTAVAGVVGTLLIVAGAAVAVPGFVRFLHQKKWPMVRASFRRSLVATLLLIGATIGLSAWAHQLNTAQHNGSDHWYSAAFVTFALLAVVTIGLWTKAGVAVVSRIDFSERALRWESKLAIGVCLASLVVIFGAALWWAQLALHAPWFLQGAPNGTAASPWSVELIVALSFMAIGTMMSLWGAWRVAITFRSASTHS